ncbi:hypothetical protein ACOSQ3_015966 [Xanthoceras sorbifolium]
MIDGDGAAALVLVSGETAAKHGFQVIGKITAYADAIQAPEIFATAPAIQSSNIRWSDIYLGKESMSNALKYLAEARKGSGLGHSSLLMECQRRIMGMIVACFERGIAAQDAGAFAWEITPVRHLHVEVSGHRRRPSTVVDKDEVLRKFDPAKLRNVRPSFKESEGTVTARNAYSISVGLQLWF